MAGAYGWQPYQLLVPIFKKFWKAHPPGVLGVCPGLYLDSFTFTFIFTSKFIRHIFRRKKLLLYSKMKFHPEAGCSIILWNISNISLIEAIPLCLYQYSRLEPSKRINLLSICKLVTSFDYIQSSSGQYWTILAVVY